MDPSPLDEAVKLLSIAVSVALGVTPLIVTIIVKAKQQAERDGKMQQSHSAVLDAVGDNKRELTRLDGRIEELGTTVANLAGQVQVLRDEP